jgi:hypothetical protein
LHNKSRHGFPQRLSIFRYYNYSALIFDVQGAPPSLFVQNRPI